MDAYRVEIRICEDLLYTLIRIEGPRTGVAYQKVGIACNALKIHTCTRKENCQKNWNVLKRILQGLPV